MYTIAVHNGSNVSREHNRRNPTVINKEPHINQNGDYEIWQDVNPRTAYEQLFGDAVADYNSRQKRSDRKIKDYYDDICHDKNKHVVYECIVGVYSDKDSDPLPLSLNKKILEEYVRRWEERNPNLHLIGAYYHNDEQGKQPHIHLDYVPVAHGYKRGLHTQNGLVKALGMQGYTKSGRETAQMQWQAAERDALEELCFLYAGISVEHPQAGKGAVHLHTQAYKAQQELFSVWEQLDEAKRQLDAMPDITQEREKRQKLLEDLRRIESRLQELKPVTEALRSLQGTYNGLLSAMQASWDALVKSQTITADRVPQITPQTISRGLRKETVYTVTQSDAQNIQALYKHMSAKQLYEFNDTLKRLPVIKQGIDVLNRRTHELSQLLDKSETQNIVHQQGTMINALQHEVQVLQAENEELQELRQFINDYNLDADLQNWQEQQQSPNLSQDTELQQMDFDEYYR